MQSRLERLIKAAYKKWRSRRLKAGQAHPDEEALACFLENKLSAQESESIEEHLTGCDACAEILAVSIKAGLKVGLEKNVPEELARRVKDLAGRENGLFVLEAVLQLKEKFLEILSATGDILVGREFVPAPVLRSRKIRDFKDEVTILKDFKDIRVEARIENRNGRAFDLAITVKDKHTHRVIRDLRVALLKDDLELESYLTDLSSVSFENVLAGKYVIQISNIEDRVASIILDIRQ